MTEHEYETVICKQCGAEVHELAVFPGTRCLACHAKRFDAMQTRPTGKEIVQMFKSSVKGKGK